MGASANDVFSELGRQGHGITIDAVKYAKMLFVCFVLSSLLCFFDGTFFSKITQNNKVCNQ